MLYYFLYVIFTVVKIYNNLPDQIIQSALAYFHHGPPGTQKCPPPPQIGMATKNTPQFQGSELFPL